MAKVNIEFDTVNKAMSVLVDGQPVGDCDYIGFYNYNDCCAMEMSLKPDKFDGMVSHLRVCAAQDPKIEGEPVNFTEDGTLVKYEVKAQKKRWW